MAVALVNFHKGISVQNQCNKNICMFAAGFHGNVIKRDVNKQKPRWWKPFCRVLHST